MPSTPSYTLGARQKALYTHVCDLWGETYPVNGTTGVPGDTTLTLLWTGVPCRYQQTINVDDATNAGRAKRMSALTTDTLHMHSDQQIKDGWITVCRGPVGIKGDIHKVEGDPKVIPSLAKKQSVEVMTMEQPPAEILTYYGGDLTP